MPRRRAAPLLAALTVAALGTGSASADSQVIPDSPELPWTDPRHETPFERVASGIATTIAGRPVRAQCNGQRDWVDLVSSFGSDAPSVWGFVEMPAVWSPESGVWLESSTHIQLGPNACEHLWRYAKAATKPTKCAAWRTVREAKRVTVRYRATVRMHVRRRVKVRGRWVVRRVAVVRPVWKSRAETRRVTRTVPLEPRPCTESREPNVTLAPPAGGWTAYERYAFAMQTLAHESAHLYDFTAGRPLPASTGEMESRAECMGMQNIARVASALGSSLDDAVSIAAWYPEWIYPARQTQTPEYWSADCRQDGPLDVSPGDGRWP